MRYNLFVIQSVFPYAKYLKTHALKPAKGVFLRLALACLLGPCLLLTGCGMLFSDPPAPKPLDVTGVSGTVNPQAEQLLAKAHILWKNTEVCSDPEQAVIYLDQALALEPEYAAALLRRGVAYSEIGFHDKAFDDLTSSIRLVPSAEAYAYRGLALLRQGSTTGALQDLELAIQKNPDFFRAWNFRAALHLKEGHLEAACKDFVTACSKGDCSGIEKARTENMCR